jgi:hypothetical protein
MPAPASQLENPWFIKFAQGQRQSNGPRSISPVYRQPADGLRGLSILGHRRHRSVGILDVDRKEPDAAMFRIPPEYKLLDETPVEPQAKR